MGSKPSKANNKTPTPVHQPPTIIQPPVTPVPEILVQSEESFMQTNELQTAVGDLDDMSFFSGFTNDDDFAPNVAPPNTLFLEDDGRASNLFGSPKPPVIDFSRDPSPEVADEEIVKDEKQEENVEETKPVETIEEPKEVIEIKETTDEIVPDPPPQEKVEIMNEIKVIVQPPSREPTPSPSPEPEVPDIVVNKESEPVVEEKEPEAPAEPEENVASEPEENKVEIVTEKNDDNSESAIEIEENSSVIEMPDVSENEQDSGIDEEMEVDDEDTKFIKAEFSPIIRKPSETSFDLSQAKEDFLALQEFVRKKGLYQAIPTMDILQRAQKCIRLFNVKPPRENGMPLPFPFIAGDRPSLLDDPGKDVKDLKVKDTFCGLLSALKGMSSSKDELLKVRTICRWLAENRYKVPVEMLMHERRGLKRERFYAELFCGLCKFCGVQCAVIEGRRKTFAENDPLDAGTCKASWCAVLVKGQWRFVDSSLPSIDTFIEFIPSSEIRRYEASPDAMTRRQDGLQMLFMDCYFLMDQEIMIASHLPKDEFWQLLCRTVSEAEWLQGATVTPFFHSFGLSVQMKTSRVIRCNGGPLIVTFTYPTNRFLLFVSDVIDEEKNLVPKDIAHTTVESDLRIKSVTIQMYVLKPGHYGLCIFCKDLTAEQNGYVLICTHDVDAVKENASTGDDQSVPPEGRQNWGPADDTLLAGILPISHMQSTIECVTDILDLVFGLQKDDIELRLVMNDVRGTDFSKRAIYWTENGKLCIKINSPGHKACILNIYHVQYTKTETSGATKLICSYKINFNSRNMVHMIASFPEKISRVGITKHGVAQGLMPLFRPVCFLIMIDETHLEFHVRDDFPQRIVTSLKYMSERVRDVDNYAMWYIKKNSLTVSVNPPRTGFFILTVSLLQDKGGLLPLYNGLLRVDVPSSKWSSYAQKHAEAHTKICRVLFPPYATLIAKTQVSFSFFIREAVDVAVVTANGWNHLHQTKNNHWDGLVETGPKSTDVKVCGRFEPGNETFTTLFVYKTMSEEEEAEMTRRQEMLRSVKEKEYQRKMDDIARHYAVQQMPIKPIPDKPESSMSSRETKEGAPTKESKDVATRKETKEGAPKKEAKEKSSKIELKEISLKKQVKERSMYSEPEEKTSHSDSKNSSSKVELNDVSVKKQTKERSMYAQPNDNVPNGEANAETKESENQKVEPDEPLNVKEIKPIKSAKKKPVKLQRKRLKIYDD